MPPQIPDSLPTSTGAYPSQEHLTGVIGTVLWVLLWALPLMAGIAVAVLAARFFLWVTKKETVPRWIAYFTERRKAAK